MSKLFQKSQKYSIAYWTIMRPRVQRDSKKLYAHLTVSRILLVWYVSRYFCKYFLQFYSIFHNIEMLVV